MNYDLVIEKIVTYKGFENEKEVAKLFGLSAPDLSNRKKRGSLLPFIVAWALNEKVNLNWLLSDDEIVSGKTGGGLAGTAVGEAEQGYGLSPDMVELVRLLDRYGNKALVENMQQRLMKIKQDTER